MIVHTILGLPGESENDILATMEYLNHRDIQGIKLQLLHVLKGTDLAQEYLEGKFHVYEREEYLNLLIQCLEHLDPKIVIHRMTGDGRRSSAGSVVDRQKAGGSEPSASSDEGVRQLAGKAVPLSVRIRKR